MSEEGQIEPGDGLENADTQEGEAQQSDHEGEGGQEGQPEGERQPRTVPHSALHEERQKRKEAEERARRAEEEHRRFMEQGNLRLQQLVALAQQQRPAPVQEAQPLPTLDTDPVGFVGHLEKTLTQKIQTVEQQNAQILADRQRQEQIAQLTSIVQAQVQSFSAQQPDYQDAYQYVKAVKAAQYRALGVPEQQIVAQLAQDEVAFAATAVQNQRNIAESLYEFAKASGYTPKAAERKPSETLAAEAKGVAAAKSLGTGGGVSRGAPSLEALAAMSDAEFIEATEGENWRRLMGG